MTTRMTKDHNKNKHRREFILHSNISNPNLSKSPIFFVALSSIIIVTIFFSIGFILKNEMKTKLSLPVLMNKELINFSNSIDFVHVSEPLFYSNSINIVKDRMYVDRDDNKNLLDEYHLSLKIIEQFSITNYKNFDINLDLDEDFKNQLLDFFNKNSCLMMKNDPKCSINYIKDTYRFGLNGYISMILKKTRTISIHIDNFMKMSNQTTDDYFQFRKINVKLQQIKVFNELFFNLIQQMEKINEKIVDRVFQKLVYLFIYGGVFVSLILSLILSIQHYSLDTKIFLLRSLLFMVPTKKIEDINTINLFKKIIEF